MLGKLFHIYCKLRWNSIVNPPLITIDFKNKGEVRNWKNRYSDKWKIKATLQASELFEMKNDRKIIPMSPISLKSIQVLASIEEAVHKRPVLYNNGAAYFTTLLYRVSKKSLSDFKYSYGKMSLYSRKKENVF